jgi:hypothetical protein
MAGSSVSLDGPTGYRWFVRIAIDESLRSLVHSSSYMGLKEFHALLLGHFLISYRWYGLIYTLKIFYIVPPRSLV